MNLACDLILLKESLHHRTTVRAAGENPQEEKRTHRKATAGSWIKTQMGMSPKLIFINFWYQNNKNMINCRCCSVP